MSHVFCKAVTRADIMRVIRPSINNDCLVIHIYLYVAYFELIFHVCIYYDFHEVDWNKDKLFQKMNKLKKKIHSCNFYFHDFFPISTLFVGDISYVEGIANVSNSIVYISMSY